MFTYADDLTADRDKIRFSIADTEYDAGPKPNGSNFTDAELDGLLSIEGTWQKAVAAAFETLAALWATHQSFTVGDVQVGQTSIGISYRDQASTWRKRFGTTATTTSGSSAVTRADGYSDTLDNMSA